jgi:hypothetical protein
MSIGPRVDLTSPGDADQEKDTASDEEKDANEVQLLEGLPLRLTIDV